MSCSSVREAMLLVAHIALTCCQLGTSVVPSRRATDELYWSASNPSLEMMRDVRLMYGYMETGLALLLKSARHSLAPRSALFMQGACTLSLYKLKACRSASVLCCKRCQGPCSDDDTACLGQAMTGTVPSCVNIATAILSGILR